MACEKAVREAYPTPVTTAPPSSVEMAAEWLAGIVYAFVPTEQLMSICGGVFVDEGGTVAEADVDWRRLRVVCRMALEQAQFALVGDVMAMLTKVSAHPSKVATPPR